MLRATLLLLPFSLALVGPALLSDEAAAHGCIQGSHGPSCSTFCPDGGAPHVHLGPQVGPVTFAATVCFLPTGILA